MRRRGRYSNAVIEELLQQIESGEKTAQQIEQEMDLSEGLVAKWQDRFAEKNKKAEKKAARAKKTKTAAQAKPVAEASNDTEPASEAPDVFEAESTYRAPEADAVADTSDAGDTSSDADNGDNQGELDRLRREVQNLREDNQVLKQAIGVISRN